MLNFRSWLILLLAGGCFSSPLNAQEESAGSTGAGAASGQAAPSTGGSPFGGASSSFGAPSGSSPFGPSSSAPATTSPAPAPSTGAPASAFGSEPPAGGTPAGSSEAPATYSVSRGYGQAPQLFVSGEGRLSRPTFDTRISTAIGFDDNVFQTPTHPQEIPEQVVRVQVTEGTPDQLVTVPVEEAARPQRIGPIAPAPRQPRTRTILIPGQEPEFEDIVIPGVPKPKRQVSAISRGSVTFEAQSATRRSLFTFDLNANADYYWNRPGKKSDYNGSLALIYLRRLTPRLQFTASVSAAYLSQPDVTLINTPIRTGSGSYLNVNSKADVSYRWTPRFSTVSSLTYNSLNFVDKPSQSGNYFQTGFGTEFRYLWSAKLTAVVEGRYNLIRYEQAPTIDSHSYFALGGIDLRLTRRAAATIRMGGSVRVFEETGESSLAPYLESALTYQLGRASVLQWSNRFGFEEPGDANSEVLGLRSGVTVTHFFSPRVRGSLGLAGIHRITTNDVADTETIESTLDTNFNLEYTLNRAWSFNFTYNYTAAFVDPGESDYFRNRIFLTANYSF
jgi:hypothetical protein